MKDDNGKGAHARLTTHALTLSPSRALTSETNKSAGKATEISRLGAFLSSIMEVMSNHNVYERLLDHPMNEKRFVVLNCLHATHLEAPKVEDSEVIIEHNAKLVRLWLVQ